MESDRKLIIAFDIYGTLLDTDSISSALQSICGLSAPRADSLTKLWRRYQLEYTWRLNSMNRYEPFDAVTWRSLQHAAAEMDQTIDEQTAIDLLDCYNNLFPFEDTIPALLSLRDSANVEVVILSNGTQNMVSTALAASFPPSLRSLSIHSVDAIQRYKPAREVYDGLLNNVGKTATPEDVWLVSGNPFDVTGARAAGLRAIWVDRAGKGWQDRLGDAKDLGPTNIVRSLEEVITVISGEGTASEDS